mmetsp:Transcript_34711/g.80557  ORF Transcript_34711/g.80557 Transcript_34711/m.80557 type:complete len:275 (-) Transcript_34711:70-894(-)
MKAESTDGCFGLACLKRRLAKERFPYWLQTPSTACTKSVENSTFLATASSKSSSTCAASRQEPLTRRVNDWSESCTFRLRAKASTRLRRPKSLRFRLSASIICTTCSVRGTWSSSGKSSAKRPSLQASSRICKTMCRGAVEGVVEVGPSGPQVAFSSRKYAVASSSLFVFSAVLMTTRRVRVLKGTPLAFISAATCCTSEKLRDMKWTLRRASYVRWSGAKPTLGSISMICSMRADSKCLPRDARRSFTRSMQRPLFNESLPLKNACSSLTMQS